MPDYVPPVNWTEVRREVWDACGCRCTIVLRQPTGIWWNWWCGYVSPLNPDFNASWLPTADDIIPVYGGFSFALKNEDGSLIFGFDQNHGSFNGIDVIPPSMPHDFDPATFVTPEPDSAFIRAEAERVAAALDLLHRGYVAGLSIDEQRAEIASLWPESEEE